MNAASVERRLPLVLLRPGKGVFRDDKNDLSPADFGGKNQGGGTRSGSVWPEPCEAEEAKVFES